MIMGCFTDLCENAVVQDLHRMVKKFKARGVHMPQTPSMDRHTGIQMDRQLNVHWAGYSILPLK